MVHLRIVAPAARSGEVLDLLSRAPAVCNVVHLAGVARRPDGDLVLADVAREEASVVVDDLRRLGVAEDGSIALEAPESQLSARAERAEREAPGVASDAVVWEEVEERTSEEARLSASLLAFFVLAALIAAIGIFENSAILIVGAMVVGPEFGPIAGFCVALVQRRLSLAAQACSSR